MSKQRFEVLVIGAGRHQQKVRASIFKALDGEFADAAKWSFPDKSAHAELIGTGLDLSLQVFSVSIDNDQLDSPPQEGNEYWRKQLASGVASVEALQGFSTGFAIDPLESAIGTVVSIITDHPACSERIAKHLDDLLALQLKRLDQ